MKERYIQCKLDNIKKEIEEKKSMKKTSRLITGLAAVGTAVFTISSAFSFPGFALASLVATGALGIAYYKFGKMYDEEIDRLNNEKSHLNIIRNKTPDATPQLNQKRLKKLKALKGTYEKQEKSYNIANGIDIGLRVTEVVGAALAFANPWLSLIGLGGVALNLITAKYMVNKKKNMENTELRYNNIENDIQVIINHERDEQAARISNRKVMRPANNTNQNTKQKPLPGRGTNQASTQQRPLPSKGANQTNTQPTQVYRPLPNRSNNQQAVNAYVNNLANQNTVQTVNQKIKK